MASLTSVLPLAFLLLTTYYHLGEARTFRVGGDHGWKVPEPKTALTLWAGTQRFLIGDSLEFDYDNKTDSVLQVTSENYDKCITEKPMKEYKEKLVKLEVKGLHYFISGVTGNCHKDEKLIVSVMSPDHPPMPKPVPAAAPPTPSKPPTSPAAPAPPTPSKPPTSPAAPAPPTPSKTPTSPTPAPPTPTSPTPAPANNTAVGLVAGSGIFWAIVAVIGLAWA